MGIGLISLVLLDLLRQLCEECLGLKEERDDADVPDLMDEERTARYTIGKAHVRFSRRQAMDSRSESRHA